MSEGTKNYMKIFEEMVGKKEYDEKKLKEKFRKERFIHNLNYEKNYLFQMILKSMRNFYSSQPPHNLFELADIDFLLRKGLTESALPLLERNKRKTLEQEEYAEHLLFRRYEGLLITATQDMDLFYDYMETGYAEEQQAMLYWQNYLFIMHKRNELNYLYMKFYFVNRVEYEKRLKLVLKDARFKNLYEHLSPKGRILYKNFFSLYHFMSLNFAEAYRFSKNLIEYISDSSLHEEEAGVENYVVTLAQHMTNCIYAGKFEEGMEWLGKTRSMHDSGKFSRKPQVQNLLAKIYWEGITSVLTLTGQFKECVALFEKHQDQIQQQLAELGIEFISIVEYYQGLSYFGLGNYDKASDIAAVLMERRNLKGFSFQIHLAQVLYVMCHIELGNAEYVLNYLRSFHRYFDKQELRTTTVKELEKIFRNLVKHPGEKGYLRQTIRESLTLLRELEKNKYESYFIRNTMMRQWLERKLAAC